MSDSSESSARKSNLSITDLVLEAMTDFGEKEFTRCVIIAMNDDGTRRYLYSNARSEPEMFGMISMASADWSNDISEEDE